LYEWDIDYGLPVLRGDILTGRLVYLAVKRHYDDLVHGPKRGLAFEPEHGWHVINYIERFCAHQRATGGQAHLARSVAKVLDSGAVWLAAGRWRSEVCARL
jgi:hypothetical protein